MTFEIKWEFIDKFTNYERYVLARIQILSFKFQLRKIWKKNIQNQTEFNVNLHDEHWCHSENVLIEKAEFSNKLNNEYMTISKELKHVLEYSSRVSNKQRLKNLKNESSDFYIA
jgi:hypothetical protein